MDSLQNNTTAASNISTTNENKLKININTALKKNTAAYTSEW